MKNQTPFVLWFTGLSGAGKTTLSCMMDVLLYEMGMHTFLLDGDNVRRGLTKDLSFSDADRCENIRRVAEVTRLMLDAGLVVLTAFISPLRSDRAMARSLFASEEFIEVYVSAPLEVTERRDPKGLYKKARQGMIPNFTGIDSLYEPPQSPEISLPTGSATPQQCVEKLLHYLQGRELLPHSALNNKYR